MRNKIHPKVDYTVSQSLGKPVFRIKSPCYCLPHMLSNSPHSLFLCCSCSLI